MLTILQYECAAFIVDSWMADVAHGRTNIAPSKIPWDLMRALITESYGGKIDDAGDYQSLSDLVDSLLTPAAFEVDHKIVQAAPARKAEEYTEGDGSLTAPEGNEMTEFMEWVNRLPEREPPTYLGLPANAEKVLLVGHGQKTITNLRKITEILDESEQLAEEVDSKA